LTAARPAGTRSANRIKPPSDRSAAHRTHSIQRGGEVIGLAEKEKKGRSSKAKKLTQKAVGVGKIFLRSSAKLAIKAATLGALDGAEAESIAKEMSDEIADATSELADKYLEKLLTDAGERKTTLDGFRTALSELPALLKKPVAADEGESNHFPLIFIVDELDRCIPPFALHILERVKHVFSVQNIHFVFGVHLEQLCNSVKAQYGSEIDARAYLEKFIHITVPLVDTAEYENESVSKRYIKFLSSKLPSDGRIVELLNEFMLRYANRTGLTLRALQRVYTTIALASSVANNGGLFIAPLVAGLAVLKLQHPSLYRRAKKGTLRYAEIEDIFGFSDRSTEENQQHKIEWSAGFWRFATDPDIPLEIRAEYDSALWKYNLTPERLLPVLANDIIDRFKPL
jgi:hypothetical protein